MISWTDRPSTSVRSDGAKMGAFVVDGRLEYWGYPKNWRPHCELTALGPFETLDQAKYAVDTNLDLEIPK